MICIYDNYGKYGNYSMSTVGEEFAIVRVYQGGQQVFCSTPGSPGKILWHGHPFVLHIHLTYIFKQSIHDLSYMSVELLSLTGQG